MHANFHSLRFLKGSIDAHLDEFKSSGGDCNPAKDACFGGYARLKTEINQQRANRANDSLLLEYLILSSEPWVVS